METDTIVIANISPASPSIKFETYQDIVSLIMQLQSSTKYAQKLLEFLQINKDDVQQKIAFLQQPNAFLSYETIFYELFNDQEFFRKYIQPLIRGRSIDLIPDIFLNEFAEALWNRDFVPPSRDSETYKTLEKMYLQAGLQRQFNAFEMALLFFMCSFYWSVDDALLRLYRTIVLKN